MSARAATFTHVRSWLFVPGDDERKIARGLASPADALILDLEDSVAPARKAHARALCGEALAARTGGKPMFVRVNALTTEWVQDDLAAMVRAAADGVMLPKCEGGDDVRRVEQHLASMEMRDGGTPRATCILPIVTETALAMTRLHTYGAPGTLPRLAGMLWGGEDLAADVGASTNRDAGGDYTFPFAMARAQCLFAATAAGVPAIDAVYPDFRDHAGLARETAEARKAGFTAKAAIHPEQIGPINEAFTPTRDELAWAARVIAAFGGSGDTGVAALDGRMLDRPHLRHAQRLLARVDAPSAPPGSRP